MSADPAGVRPFLLVALCLVAISSQIGSFIYLPAMPAIAAEFDTGEAGVQATLTAYLAGTFLGFALYGPLSDRLGRRRMLAITGTVFVAASVACAAADTLAALTGARVVQGFGSVAGLITARATIRDVYPPALISRNISFLTASMAVAPAMSPVLGAAMLAFVDWRLTFLAAALFSAVSIVLAFKAIPGGRRTASGVDLQHGLRGLLASPVYRSCVMISSATNGAFMIMMAGSPFVLMETYGLSELGYAGSMAIVLLTFAVVAVVFGGLMVRLGVRRTMAWGIGPMLAGAVGVVLVSALAPHLVLLLAMLTLTIAAMGLIVPAGNTAMLEPVPALAGTAVSLAQLVSTLFGALALTAYGQIAAGSAVGFALSLAGLCGVAALAWSRLPHAAPLARAIAS